LKLKDIAKIRTGLVLSRKKATGLDLEPRSYCLITLKSFGENGILSEKDFDTFYAKEPVEEDCFTKKGDIVIRLREPNIAVCIDEKNKNLLVPSLMAIVRVDEQIADPGFLTYYLNHSEDVKKSLAKEIKGTTINTVNRADLENLSLFLPPLQKQKELVAFFDFAQKEIDLLEELKVQKAKFFHKALNKITTQESNICKKQPNQQ